MIEIRFSLQVNFTVVIRENTATRLMHHLRLQASCGWHCLASAFLASVKSYWQSFMDFLPKLTVGGAGLVAGVSDGDFQQNFSLFQAMQPTADTEVITSTGRGLLLSQGLHKCKQSLVLIVICLRMKP